MVLCVTLRNGAADGTNVSSSGSEKEFIISLLRKMELNPLRNITLELEAQLLINNISILDSSDR